ncbi:MAG: hypothetical protein VST68_10750 [Nitrospirota bacterium]|nr:hypothetical protein [Nitrospirota bacterium]
MLESYILLGLILGAIAIFAWFEVTRNDSVDSNFGLTLLKRRLKTQDDTIILGSQPTQGS